ncbi:MAG TPA: beta-ketoacyl-ACP synthase II [Actinocrinis sp.]|nr:beta-ketoacyl-ACP synthase II [Actinocrinis sp.]HEV2343638.1 beta-ketoacyl-ACP synthase II [Actinocrinis sp.]
MSGPTPPRGRAARTAPSRGRAASAAPPRRRVAVTGIGVVSPLGTGIEALWSSLAAGRSGVRRISGFDADRLPVRIAGEVPDFEPRDWVSRKDAVRLDRVLHFALAAAQLAVDDAGGLAAPERTATAIGSAIGGAASIHRGVLTDIDRPQLVSPFFVPNSIANMPAAHVALRFALRGPSTATVTACAASADALGHAMRLVRDGYAEAAVAGGAEACLVSPIVAGFANMRALSTRNDEPQKASRPFDAQRDGFVLAEGAAVMVLEPLDAAVGRGAHVYAELCGFGQTNDAHHMTAPDPTGAGAGAAIELALADAGLAPERIGYINAHATSTRMADAAEALAILRTFGAHAKSLAVSATKSMTGHLLGAAGALEAAITALALDRCWIPPTINHGVPDVGHDLDYVPGRGRAQRVEAAVSNSFAFGGHNTALVLRRHDPEG